MKKLLTVLVLLAIVCFSSQAMAFVQGTDFYINNFYDYRTYDASHPDANVLNKRGGWQIGISIFGPEMAAETHHVVIYGLNEAGVIERLTRINKADVYGWLGDTMHDYILFEGVDHTLCWTYEIQLYRANGTLIEVDLGDGILRNIIPVFPIVKDAPLPSICKIKKMAIMKNGDLKMRFTAPYHPDAAHIRIRIFDDSGNGLWETRINQPYEIVKKDGTVIPDKVRVLDIPAEYAGHPGRIEYRTTAISPQPGYDYHYMIRGITYFKLPELEEVE